MFWQPCVRQRQIWTWQEAFPALVPWQGPWRYVTNTLQWCMIFVQQRWQAEADVRFDSATVWSSVSAPARMEKLQQASCWLKKVDTRCLEPTAKWRGESHLWLVTLLKPRIIAGIQRRGGDALTLHKSFANKNHKYECWELDPSQCWKETYTSSAGSPSLSCHIHGWVDFFPLG